MLELYDGLSTSILRRAFFELNILGFSEMVNLNCYGLPSIEMEIALLFKRYNQLNGNDWINIFLSNRIKYIGLW